MYGVHQVFTFHSNLAVYGSGGVAHTNTTNTKSNFTTNTNTNTRNTITSRVGSTIGGIPVEMPRSGSGGSGMFSKGSSFLNSGVRGSVAENHRGSVVENHRGSVVENHRGSVVENQATEVVEEYVEITVPKRRLSVTQKKVLKETEDGFKSVAKQVLL
ncbi:hypothetical protein HDU76_012093 [Blyttiomyces sp. JEL0837]|nr:hypothetical protein HDU76_012093 [Blyttiomyces sp. JEL0837]